MDPAVPWQYTYNRLAAQGATSGDLHHHFAQAANNSALTSGQVSGVPSTTSQLLLQAAHSTPLGASSASFATPSSFLSAPSYDVFSPLFAQHAHPKPAHFNTINAAAQHRQQVLAAQAAVTKQTSDSDVIRENYSQHHSSISTPQSGSYFEQSSGSAVAAALSWQTRQSDFTNLRSQGDLNSNNQLPSAFGILPHENVSSSPAPAPPTATKHSTSSGSSSGVYESFNAHFPQPLNQANAIIKSSSTARSMSPQQPQQQIKQQAIASTSAPSTSVYYQTPSSSSTYQNLQSSFANSKTISQQEQLQHQQTQHSNYNNSSNNQAISGSKSSFSSSTGISSSSQLNSSSDPSSSLKEFSNSSHHISSRVKSERSESPAIGAAHNFASSATQLYKLSNNVPNQIQTKAALKAILPHGAAASAAAAVAALHGQVSTMHNNSNNNNVIQPSPISISLLENQVAYSDSNNSSHSASNSVGGRNASSVRKLSKQAQEYQRDSASLSSSSSPLSSIPNPNTNDCSHIVIPRRPSPHQISSQPSPLGTVPSPAYPMYNSPMNPSQSPIDASTSRTTSSKSNNQVAYSSVIQRTAIPSNWDGSGGSLQSQAQSIYNQTPAQITKLHQISPVQTAIDSQTNNHFSGNSQLASNPNTNTITNTNTNHNHNNHSHNSLDAVQKMTDSVHHIQSHTSTAFISNQQRQRQTLPSEPIKKDEPPKSRPGRKKKYNFDRAESEKLCSSPSPSTSSEYYTNERVPPPAHVPSNQQSNGSPNYNFNSFHNHNSTMISHPSIPSHASHHHHYSHHHPHHPSHAISHPYFPSFSMPLGVSDYSTTTDLNLSSVSMVANIPCNDSIGTPSVSSNYSPTTSEIREDEPPKVIVPNIEEELGFLAENSRSGNNIQQPSSAQLQHQSTAAAASTPNHLTLLGATSNALQSHQTQSNHQQAHMQHSSHTNQNANNSQSSSSNQMSQQQKTPLTDKKFPTPTGPGSGFMASYLKFLQGERDTSPPPVNRGGGGRKTWSRTTNQSAAQVSPSQQPTNVNQTTNAKNQMSNGMNVHNSMMGGGVYDRKRTAPVDDDDSSDSVNNKQPSNKNSKKQTQQSIVERAPQVPINVAKKGRAAQSSHSNSFLSSQQSTQQNNPIGLQQNPQLLMQQHLGQQQILGQQQMYYPQDEDPLLVPQRRETTHRKAKGRSILNSLQNRAYGLDSNQADDLEEPPEFVDSDSDPAWTPQKDDDDDDDVPRRKLRKNRSNNRSCNQKRGAAKFNNPTTADNSNKGEYSNVKQKTDTSMTNSAVSQPNFETSNNHQQQQQPNDFQAGEFIVSRQDMFQDWPPIWRVDSKTLLQKFEPFHSNNKTIYRSLSTYAQWAAENRRSYVLVKCQYVGQIQNEMHVELLRNELCSSTSDMYIEKMMQDALAYQDQFEVYIQTLISQGLDSNFLTEIMQEQDEYFLSNVKTIDDLTAGRKLRLRNCTTWPARMLYSLETWPCYNIINDLGVTNNGQIICAACNKRSIVSRVILYGQPYNPNTIGAIQLDGRFPFEKDFLLCRNCVTRCELFHKIAHQKYLMFMQCSKKVSEKNELDPTKGTTVILNELLADEVWLAELFKNVRRAWAEVDQAERQHRCSS